MNASSDIEEFFRVQLSFDLKNIDSLKKSSKGVALLKKLFNSKLASEELKKLGLHLLIDLMEKLGQAYDEFEDKDTYALQKVIQSLSGIQKSFEKLWQESD